MVELSISEIRRALWLANTPAVASEARKTETGRIFHEIVADLMGPNPELQWQAALDALPGEDDSRRLQHHVYDRLLGPKLTERQAALAESGASVWHLWRATGELCCWLSRVLRKSQEANLLRFDPASQTWTGSELLYEVEKPLQWTVQEPGWTAAVRVTGVADAVWFNGENGRWSVLEYKLSDAAPAIALAQVFLYREMLVNSGLGRHGAVSLLFFRPELEEMFFSPEMFFSVRQKLMELIGRLADVMPGTIPAAAQETDSDLAAEAAATGKRILSTLAQYGVSVHLGGDAVLGPSFLRFPVALGRGVKVAQVAARGEELQVHLGLSEQPMIHKSNGTLVIDVKRAHPEPVLFSAIVNKLPSPRPLKGSSRIPVGVDLSGHLHDFDLAQNPHLLVAGTSNSGKSEWLRTAVAGLLATNTPETLRLITIDPKRSAFLDLAGSPFLWNNMGLIFPGDHSIPDLLDSLIEEMERRYELFKGDDLAAYVDRTKQPKPRIVCLCDEYADLVADKAARREIEPRIARLGAKARAAGIHLVLATQYPKADVVTSIIKANLSGRVCLRVTDAKQSQVVLGRSGAEKLLGRGDLFFLDIGDPVRLQAAFLPKEDRERIFGAKSAIYGSSR